MFRLAKWAGLTVALMLFMGIPAAWAQTGGASGHVTLLDGTACVKCIIIIDRVGTAGHYQTKTDKKGNYIYIGLPPDNYKITAQDPDGKTLFYISHHLEIGDPTVVDFNLPKEQADQQKTQQSNPQAQAQAAQQAKESQQFNSLKEMFTQGTALEANKQWADAVALYQKAEPLAKGKNQAVIMEHEASAMVNGKMYDQAVAEYQKLITLDPTNAAYFTGMGSAYADEGKMQEANDACTKSGAINPTNGATCYFNIGANANNAGKMDDAAAAFKKVTELDPKNAAAFYLEGQALMGKATMSADNKIVPAPGTVEALQAYLQLEPNGKYAESAQGMLQSIQGQVQTEFKAQPKKKKSN